MNITYESVIEASGAKVLHYKESGGYQGEWMMIIELNGEVVAITDYYGSCSGCDSLEAEFFGHSLHFDGYNYYVGWKEVTKELYEKEEAVVLQRMAEFGKSYLQTPLSRFDIENWLANNPKGEDYSFDDEKRELYEWALSLLP